MLHKYPNILPMKHNYGEIKRKVPSGGGSFYFMPLVMILISSFCVNIEAKALIKNEKSVKLFKSSSFPSSSSSLSLLKSRHKRDTFANEHEPQHSLFIREINEDAGAEEDYDEDDNYGVIPDMTSSGDDAYRPQQPPHLGDQISEKAKQVAESFSKMWQSLTDSIGHCINAFRQLFDDDKEGSNNDDEMLQQEQQLRVAMEEYYRAKTMHDNEILTRNYENNL